MDALLQLPSMPETSFSSGPAMAGTTATAVVPMSVSVVMPAKNAAAHIREAIESVLAQGSEVAELIIVDDRSTDDTVSIVRSLNESRIRLAANDGTGVSAARNLGARMAGGRWLMFLDADDRLRPDAVSKLVAAAKTTQRAVVVYGDYDLIDSEGSPIGRRGLLKQRSKPSGQVLERLAAGNFIVNGGVMIIRSNAFNAVGGFDESLRYCEDWHCWCRLAAVGQFQFIRTHLLDYRVHAANTMNAALRSPRDFFPAVEKVFDDKLILGKLPRDAAPGLRTAAEIHLVTYAAAQAIRFRRYREAFSYVRMVGRRSLLSVPRAVVSLGLSYVGI
jgi:glycosyltransferase involved in cell wall biosynthesis